MNFILRNLSEFIANDCVVPENVIWNPFCNEE